MEEEYDIYQDGCPQCGGYDDNILYNGDGYQECECGWYARIIKSNTEIKSENEGKK